MKVFLLWVFDSMQDLTLLGVYVTEAAAWAIAEERAREQVTDWPKDDYYVEEWEVQ